MRKLAIWLFPLFLWSCATPEGILLEETPLNMSDSRVAIISVIGQPRAISENGREVFSKYYDEKGLDFNPARAKERFGTHVLILGDRRPYDIRVIVEVTRKKGDQYELVGYDNNRAERLAERIKKALNESKDKRNVIDDFKPY